MRAQPLISVIIEKAVEEKGVDKNERNETYSTY